jgi:uncharacterized protein YfeS
MTRFIVQTVLTSVVFVSCSNAQTTDNSVVVSKRNRQMDHFGYSFRSAHPAAKELMPDDFFWSVIEETAPFGSDDGSDAAYGFKDWRISNKTTSPINYLKDLIKRWHYPPFDYNEMDTIKIAAYINKKAELDEAAIQYQVQQLKDIDEKMPDATMTMDDNQLRQLVISSANSMGRMYLLGQDNAIIGIGFAQFVLEGKIDNDIKYLTITAIKRELLPLLINLFEVSYRTTRKQQLTRMLEVVNKVNP